jgi:hypothetical protein
MFKKAEMENFSSLKSKHVDWGLMGYETLMPYGWLSVSRINASCVSSGLLYPEDGGDAIL